MPRAAGLQFVDLDRPDGSVGMLLRGTTTFTATANGANVSVTDIDTALHAGNDVVVTSVRQALRRETSRPAASRPMSSTTRRARHSPSAPARGLWLCRRTSLAGLQLMNAAVLSSRPTPMPRSTTSRSPAQSRLPRPGRSACPPAACYRQLRSR